VPKIASKAEISLVYGILYARINRMNAANLLKSTSRIFLAFFILHSIKAQANIDRRGFLQSLLAVGSASVLSTVSISSGLEETSPLVRDLAEIRNLQWERARQPFAYRNRFFGQYLQDLENLDLRTDRGKTIRDTMLDNLNGILDQLELQAQQTLRISSNEKMLSKEGQNIHEKLTDSLIYNITLIRSMLSTKLLMKVNAQLGYEADLVLVTDSEMLILFDYFQLLKINLQKFNVETAGYGLLQRLLDDTNNWFPKVMDMNLAPVVSSVSSCRTLLR